MVSARRFWHQRTPLGEVTVVAGDAGIVRLALPGIEVSPVDADPERDEDIASQLDEYFSGRRTTFDVRVDLSEVAGFRRDVLETLHRDVPYGETVTYGELAEMAGRPRAARAVGTTMAGCPVPIVIPCHRVVAAGGIGGYGGGLARRATAVRVSRAAASRGPSGPARSAESGMAGIEMKRALLALEGVHLR